MITPCFPLQQMAGGEFIGFNNSVFLAEKDVSDRNYALAYYMKENGCFPKGVNVKECIDFWYQVRKEMGISGKLIDAPQLFFSQCCSMEVNCESLAVIAATLANGGECPTTWKRVVSPEAVRDVLSLLHSCGFYEFSGQVAFSKVLCVPHALVP